MGVRILLGTQMEKIPYQEVFLIFNKRKIKYAVCGGMAVLIYGYPRLTVDLDLIVALNRKNLKKIFDALSQLGYLLKTLISKEDFISVKRLKKLSKEKNMKVISFYHQKDPLKIVDIFLAFSNWKKILERKKIFKLKNFKIPVISIEDLIELKKMTKRKQDLIDLEYLEKIKKHEER